MVSGYSFGYCSCRRGQCCLQGQWVKRTVRLIPYLPGVASFGECLYIKPLVLILDPRGIKVGNCMYPEVVGDRLVPCSTPDVRSVVGGAAIVS